MNKFLPINSSGYNCRYQRVLTGSLLPNFYSTMTTLSLFATLQTVKTPKQRVRSLFSLLPLTTHPIFPGKLLLSPSVRPCFHPPRERRLSLCFPSRTVRKSVRERSRESAARVLFENNKDPFVVSSAIRSSFAYLDETRVSRRVSFAEDGSYARAFFSSLLCV